MLTSLDQPGIIVVVTVILVLSFWVGYFADAILGDAGLGVLPGAVAVGFGAAVGLAGLDYAFMRGVVALRWATPYIWFATAAGTGTLLLLTVCLTLALARR